MVIVAYQPRNGQSDALLALVREHVPFLRQLGLATDRPPLAMTSRDGTVIEVFEWANGAVARAHGMPEVLALWERYNAVCDIIPLCDLAETADMFATFQPIEL